MSSGVRQGGMSSPVLFNFIIDYIMQQAVFDCRQNEIDIGFKVNDSLITDLDYADDIALFCKTESEMQIFIDRVSYHSSTVGLVLNPTKCKVLSSCLPSVSLNLNGFLLENVDYFCYLGSFISKDGSSTKEIDCRRGRAINTFQCLQKEVFSRADISLKLKVRIYEASVRSVLLYGCETWALTEQNDKYLEACEIKFLQKILGLSVLNFV